MKRSLGLLLFLGLAACAGRPFSPSGGAPANSNADTPALEASKTDVRDRILHPRGIDFSAAPEKIAFGSCANQDKPQPIWKAIVATEPDLFLFMGDNVYASSPAQQPIVEQYRKLSRIPEYREARDKIPFMATWDDHDMGTNDGGADAPTRLAARKDFANHFPYVKDSVPLGTEGLYHAKLIGGQVTGRRRKVVTGPTVQIIMLDTRSFRSPLKKAENPRNALHRYDPTTDKKATLLGEKQWDWLEDQLRKPAQLRIIVSSIQLVATEHGFEKWANFPAERERFFNLLRKTGARNVVVFSGDRHLGVISKTEVKGWGPLYDITSSALNMPGNLQETDKDYLGPVINAENFGLASVDWKRKVLKLELKDVDGKTLQFTDVKLH